jgi:hypothetical protein
MIPMRCYLIFLDAVNFQTKVKEIRYVAVLEGDPVLVMESLVQYKNHFKETEIVIHLGMNKFITSILKVVLIC